MNSPVIVSSTDFVRRFGYYADLLSTVDKLIIIRDGKPLGTFVPFWELKRERFLKSAGSLKNTSFGKGKIWRDILKRKSRIDPIDL